MHKAEALAAVARLEELVRYFGAPDEETAREFKRLVYALRTGKLQDDYFSEKLTSFDGWGQAGFSTRKFEKFQGGLQSVKVWALGELSTLGSLIELRWPG